MFINRLANWLLTASSFAPVALIYAFLALFEGRWQFATAMFGYSVVTAFSCHLLLKRAQKDLSRIPFKLESAELADKENFSILVLYLAPMLKMAFPEIWWQNLVPIAIVIVLFSITSYGYHFNPLLNLMKWHFYKVATKEGITYILLTKKELKNVDRPIIIGRLTRYTVIDLEDE